MNITFRMFCTVVFFSEINVPSDEMFSKLKIQKSVTVFSDIIIRNELYKKLIGDLYKY